MQEHEKHALLLDIEKVLGILNKISIFAGLTDKQLQALFRLLKTTSYNTGDTIFLQGTPPTHIYVVESGKVKLVTKKDDTSFELVVFEQGCCFGESSIIGIRPHAATAIAVEPTELIVLSREALMSIYDSDLELFSILILNIARETSRRLHASSETILHYIKRK
jgi:CRP-like cAMP-binding protein